MSLAVIPRSEFETEYEAVVLHRDLRTRKMFGAIDRSAKNRNGPSGSIVSTMEVKS